MGLISRVSSRTYRDIEMKSLLKLVLLVILALFCVGAFGQEEDSLTAGTDFDQDGEGDRLVASQDVDDLLDDSQSIETGELETVDDENENNDEQDESVADVDESTPEEVEERQDVSDDPEEDDDDDDNQDDISEERDDDDDNDDDDDDDEDDDDNYINDDDYTETEGDDDYASDDDDDDYQEKESRVLEQNDDDFEYGQTNDNLELESGSGFSTFVILLLICAIGVVIFRTIQKRNRERQYQNPETFN